MLLFLAMAFVNFQSTHYSFIYSCLEIEKKNLSLGCCNDADAKVRTRMFVETTADKPTKLIKTRRRMREKCAGITSFSFH